MQYSQGTELNPSAETHLDIPFGCLLITEALYNG
jgi:hypothetical protein